MDLEFKPDFEHTRQRLARYVLDEWLLEYNHRRPHSGIDWQTPAAFAAALEG